MRVEVLVGSEGGRGGERRKEEGGEVDREGNGKRSSRRIKGGNKK